MKEIGLTDNLCGYNSSVILEDGKFLQVRGNHNTGDHVDDHNGLELMMKYMEWWRAITLD